MFKFQQVEKRRAGRSTIVINESLKKGKRAEKNKSKQIQTKKMTETSQLHQ